MKPEQPDKSKDSLYSMIKKVEKVKTCSLMKLDSLTIFLYTF